MSRAPLLAVFVTLALATLAVLACPWQQRAAADARDENASATHPAVEPYLDPRLRFLLTQTARGERADESPFFRTLSALGRKQDWDQPGHYPTDGRAVGLRDGNTRYAIVVLGWEDHVLPGRDRQHLLLLGPDGRLLDQLSCGISNRRVAGTVFRTDTPKAPEENGARFIVRYLPAVGYPVWEGFRYEVDHGPKNARFQRDEGRTGPFRQEEWVRQGLCRVAVWHGKFEVLFPPLEQ